MTVKTQYIDVIQKIQNVIPTEDNVGSTSLDSRAGASLMRLTYDADGYVTDADILTDSDKGVYGATEYNGSGSPGTEPLTDDYRAYLIEYKLKGRTLKAVGRTLETNEEGDVGVTLATGAPVIVIQRTDSGELSVQV